MNKLISIFPLIMVIGANTTYHLISKTTSPKLNVFLGLIATYGVGLIGSIALYMMTKKESLSEGISHLGVGNFALGAVIILLEGGWILVYRSGFQISNTSLMANIILAIIIF